jgi:hypothetical protein
MVLIFVLHYHFYSTPERHESVHRLRIGCWISCPWGLAKLFSIVDIHLVYADFRVHRLTPRGFSWSTGLPSSQIAVISPHFIPFLCPRWLLIGIQGPAWRIVLPKFPPSGYPISTQVPLGLARVGFLHSSYDVTVGQPWWLGLFTNFCRTMLNKSRIEHKLTTRKNQQRLTPVRWVDVIW